MSRPTILLFFLVVNSASPVSAQDGLLGWAGLGVGGHEFGCGSTLTCGESRERGWSVVIGGGHSLTSFGGAGAELSVWTRTAGAVTRTQTNLSLVGVLLAHGVGVGRLFATAGAGWARLSRDTEIEESWTGLGLTGRFGVQLSAGPLTLAPTVGIATAPYRDGFVSNVIRIELLVTHR